MSQPLANPIAVEVTRGRSPETAFVESRHRASCAVVAADGTIVHGWGDVDQLVFPRSALKPIQALPLLETGAADAFGLSAAEVSLACASHSSEDRHIDAVAGLLGRIGLSPEALECGPQLSNREEVMLENVSKGVQASRLRNECSGKHSGFLTTAMHMGDDPAGYIGREHPVQKRVLEVASDMCDVDVTKMPEGIDGCSIPAMALPLASLALGMAKIADPKGLGATRAAACERIVQSIVAEPFMIAGTGTPCTALNTALKGKAIVKTGAEGIMMAAVPDKGVGVALKIDDGDKAGRAKSIALAAVLKFLGVLDDTAVASLQHHIEVPILDRNDNHVGTLKAHDDWPPLG